MELMLELASKPKIVVTKSFGKFDLTPFDFSCLRRLPQHPVSSNFKHRTWYRDHSSHLPCLSMVNTRRPPRLLALAGSNRDPDHGSRVALLSASSSDITMTIVAAESCYQELSTILA